MKYIIILILKGQMRPAIVKEDVSVSPPGLPAGCHVISQNSGLPSFIRSNLPNWNISN